MQRKAFFLVVLVTLGLFGLIGVVLVQPELVAGLAGQEMAGHISGHFRDPHHRIHDLTFSFLLGTAVVGMLAQLRRPAANVAGQLMALIPSIALAVISVITSRWVFAALPVLGALMFLATILHPAGRSLFSSGSVSRVNRVMLALVVIASGPLLAFVSTYVRLQASATDEHAALGHYGFMAAFSFTVMGSGLLASLRSDGWWLPAWAAGLLPALLGVASMLFPGESSLGLEWTIAAIAWGVGFVATAELTQDAASPTLLGSWGVLSRSEPATFPDGGRGSTGTTPGWVTALGITVVVVALLVGIMHLTGYSPGGPGGHTSPVQHGVQQP
jgi:hypothetical protein